MTRAAATPLSLDLLEPRGTQSDEGNACQDTQQTAARAGRQPIASQSIEVIGLHMSLHRWRATRSVDSFFACFLNSSRDSNLETLL